MFNSLTRVSVYNFKNSILIHNEITLGSKYFLSDFNSDKTQLSCNLHFSRENNENQRVVPKIKAF